MSFADFRPIRRKKMGASIGRSLAREQCDRSPRDCAYRNHRTLGRYRQDVGAFARFHCRFNSERLTPKHNRLCPTTTNSSPKRDNRHPSIRRRDRG
jgi:hypothetical protein